jgi:hypothetical protein
LSKISTVNEFSIGAVLFYDGVKCKITKFPTRTSVVLEAIDPIYSKWWTAKTIIRELREELSRSGPLKELNHGRP